MMQRLVSNLMYEFTSSFTVVHSVARVTCIALFWTVGSCCAAGTVGGAATSGSRPAVASRLADGNPLESADRTSVHFRLKQNLHFAYKGSPFAQVITEHDTRGAKHMHTSSIYCCMV